MADTVNYYNPNDANGVRDGGPYLDQVELVQAETRRAAVEGRKPDYDNLQPTAGVPAVTESELRNIGLVSLAGDDLPNPIASGDAIVNADEAVPSKPKTDDEKIAVAQKKALDKDADPLDSVEVSKAVAE